jgi:hypothetical protein
MEPERSLSHSQQPTTCPYPEPDRSSPSRSSPIQLKSPDTMALKCITVLTKANHQNLPEIAELSPSAFKLSSESPF